MRMAPDRWLAFVRGSRKLVVGDRVLFGEDRPEAPRSAPP
ncbi:hypothetical protein A6302_01399 [Methylobrevis pamukkalensis]|uniref:Uncharacterized protein n=1 Tax=Methylobrevis pamukkalensis TaxID=1439726 RepID=A0A1E3H4P4_9HYPH|nr:hypothetical protein A6302_01399 [Methylobrevis pamukkalensis]